MALSTEAMSRSKKYSYKTFGDNSSSSGGGSHCKVYASVVAPYLYLVSVGMAVSYTAPATVDMRRPGSRFLHITDDQITWIASLNIITCCFGCLVSGYFSQMIGRRAALILISTPYVLSWLMIAYAPGIVAIYLGRLLCGFCYGIALVATPAYVTEVSPVEIRGLLGCGFQLFFAVGSFTAMALGYALRWSWLAVSGATVVAVAACLMHFIPESPEWLCRKSSRVEAVDSLKFFKRSRSDIAKQLEDMERASRQDPPTGIGWKQFLDPVLYKPIAISVAMILFQNSSGINAMISYTVQIFQSTGSPLDAELSAMLFTGAQIIASALSGLLMDRVGRRLLFVTSGAFVTVALAALGLYSYMPRCGYDLSGMDWIPLTCLVMYVCLYGLGLGTVPYVMIPEMMPVSSRSAVLALALMCNAAFGFTVTKSFHFVVVQVGYSGFFWIYGTLSLLGTLFGLVCLPETKGKTTEEISRKFSKSIIA